MKLIRSTIDPETRVQVMGVLNLTPDSFSDGGAFKDVEQAVSRALEIEAEGADILDIGGESTRPGSKPVSISEELDRVLPVIEGLQGKLSIPISIDTSKSAVAKAAIGAGAEIINDISGLRFDAGIGQIASETRAALVLMHSRGTPKTMQKLPPVEDIISEVCDGLRWAVKEAGKLGVDREKMILDPGIGFGKTPDQNLQLINHLDRIASEVGQPILLGTSRKSFIRLTLDKIVANNDRDAVREAVAGTAASVTLGILRGAGIVRVHDVSEMVAVVRLTEAMMRS